VASDEIYQGLEYRGRAVSALAFSDNAFVINSFSKYFGMTGWRLGWGGGA
jgi:aspartate/methionine/tyrosine aminotransferase